MESAIVTKESFRDWKSNPVTKAVMSTIEDRIRNIEVELGMSAGQEPLSDRFKSGAICGYRDLVNITFEETQDD